MDRSQRAALHRRPAEVQFNEGVKMVQENTEPAVGLLRVRESADRGYLPAMLQLGTWYAEGDSVVPRDRDRAVYWLNKGAGKGHPGCKRKIGDIYRYGLLGVKRSEDRAVVWYLRAADGDDFPAIHSLWELAGSGSGAVDRMVVTPYLRHSAEKGDLDAMVFYGKELIRSGNKKEGYTWLRRASGMGSVPAKREIGFGYINGDGNIDKGLSILKGLAESGDAEAQYALGAYYSAWNRSERELQNAFGWFLRAAGQNHRAAENAVGEMYCAGRGVEKDAGSAMEYFLRAASRGSSEAMLNIGTLYDTGNGVPTLYSDAAEWYSKAADLGNAKAMVRMGRMYELGHGVERSKDEAARYYLEAREKGDPDADEALARLNSL